MSSLTRILNGEANYRDWKMQPKLLPIWGFLARRRMRNNAQGKRKNKYSQRFLNRLAYLWKSSDKIHLFDYFYQTFLETVEHLKAKGKIDDGMEDLKADSVQVLPSLRR